MDARMRRAKNTRMPVPASAIRKLSDHSGAYVICVTCRQCRHEREMNPSTLANIFGWNATLTEASTRLRCSRCQARSFNLEIAFDRKPRRWTTNPS
jgi:hypothetical protein